ncbi:MAG: L-ribulose-5-phosphate 4-epimerase AraD [Spirochaetales bacterium]|uniref:L-ribulose-5-phosphate 4-epimerase n=1 Tax=Candidatus Thalassospirochaeta sargassi TaxID=3119039 RepID=A0AAJ1IGK9_9SPIO|nr:L-ribulose-5-phosphate 4-epimerase AraD [Spirochaetales bacterium]
MSKFSELKKRVLECNMGIQEHKLAIFTWGNVSAVDRGNSCFAIKPSGVAYDNLTVDDIVVVGLDGSIIEGDRRPSSDTNTHLVLYNSFETIGGVVHTHSPYATGWAQTCTDIPIYGTTHADHLTKPVPCTAVMRDEQIEGDYETETGVQIVETFRDLYPSEVEMVLVACHGPFTWGATPEKALYNAVVLEEMARMAFVTHTVRPDTPELKESLRAKHYYRKHGKNAYYGQN